MHEESSGPSNMDKRGVVSTSSTYNAADKSIRDGARPRNGGRRGRDHPRGGHDFSSPAPSSAGAADPRRNFKGKRSQQRQQLQNPNQQQSSSSSKYFEATAGDPFSSAIAQDDEFEVGSVFNAGSKKQNLSHLLNFQFEPRGGQAAGKQHGGGRIKNQGGGGGAGRRRNNSFHRPKYNKEQYLQANCKFVVKENGDYSVHLVDPDSLVDWDCIEQVVLKTTASVPSCPICLYPPKAAKITRCGHVFCWPCILHYLALSDHAWRKCPICYEAIHKPDLKSVVSRPWKEFNIGDEIELSLMRRERNSLFAMPVSQYFAEVNDKHPNLQDKWTAHSQLVLASPGQVARTIIAKERQELEDQYRQDKDEPEACFIEEALQYLSQRESGIAVMSAKTSDIIEEDDSNSGSNEEETAASAIFYESRSSPEDFPEEFDFDDLGQGEDRPRHVSSSSDGTSSVEADGASVLGGGGDQDTFVTAEDLDISSLTNKNSSSIKTGNTNNKPKDTFYFYQSSDGQPIFLHAINVQMLVQDHGSLESCPLVIRGKILEKDQASMTEDMRNKLRYLKHLPVTSTFEVCELAMKAPLVSKETLTSFQPQLEARRRKRNRRAREERRREKWIREEENKRMGKYPDMRCRIESAFHFPDVSAAATIIPSAAPTSSRSTESLVSTSVDSTMSTNSDTFSFAKMLKDGVAKPSTAMPRSETVSAFPSLIRPKTAAAGGSDSEPEPEGYVPPPPKASLGDALAHALAQATVSDSATSANAGGSSGGKKKGKKLKGKKISLTSVARPSMD